MAHKITERDGLFVVRQAAWHGLGETLADYPTREQAQAIAHPWEPVREPLFRRVPVIGDDGTLTTSFEQIEDYELNVRSDDGGVLGAVPSGRVDPTNTELWDVAQAIEGQDPSAVMYETGGSLLGGKKVWILLRLRDPVVVAGDPHGAVIPYFALQNAYDGSSAFRGQATLTRIVCDNTAQMADLDAKARGTEFSFRHTRSIRDRIDEAKMALSGWRESVKEWERFSAHMVGVRVTEDQRERFVTEFIPMPPTHTVSDRVVTNVETARDALRSILAGETCEGIGHTAYGLVQGSIEYLNHARRANTRETRFKRAYLDRNRITTDAVELVSAITGASA